MHFIREGLKLNLNLARHSFWKGYKIEQTLPPVHTNFFHVPQRYHFQIVKGLQKFYVVQTPVFQVLQTSGTYIFSHVP